MDELANSLMEELECRTAFEIPIFLCYNRRTACGVSA